MTHVFSNTQIPLRLNTPEDFCLDDSVHLFLQATRRNESPLADLLDERLAIRKYRRMQHLRGVRRGMHRQRLTPIRSKARVEQTRVGKAQTRS